MADEGNNYLNIDFPGKCAEFESQFPQPSVAVYRPVGFVKITQPNGGACVAYCVPRAVFVGLKRPNFRVDQEPCNFLG